MTYIIRDDDVLVPSGTYTDPFKRFKQLHEAMKSAGVIHQPAIIVNGIKEFPECIEYIKEETNLGNMQPQIHCMNHQTSTYKPPQSVDYYVSLLIECREWIDNQFNYTPDTWFTPWGSSHPNQWEASNILNIKLVDMSNAVELPGVDGVLNNLKNKIKNIKDYDNIPIATHWWLMGSRVQRFCEIVKTGSWDEAVKNNPKLFK